jgi:hypothetical protein
MVKQVRFTQLVKASGRPHAATLWVSNPSKDPEFKKAIDDNRVVTIHHVNVGTKKETGEIGFVKGGGAGYLIFPRALPMAEGTRIVGLKFDMLQEPDVKDPVKIKNHEQRRKIERIRIADHAGSKQPKANGSTSEKPSGGLNKESHPLKSHFEVTVEFKAKAVRRIRVETENASGAIESALQQAKKRAPEPEWEMDASTVKRCD